MATDNCPGVSYVLTSITSNEPDNGTADGDTVQDIQAASPGTPDLASLLRAERAGSGTGRIFTIRYTASDGSGNETTAKPTVMVPHSKKP